MEILVEGLRAAGAACHTPSRFDYRVIDDIEKPRKTGLFRSRPVSRILSWVTIFLGRQLPDGSSGVPGSSAGRVNGTCFTLHRTGFG